LVPAPFLVDQHFTNINVIRYTQIKVFFAIFLHKYFSHIFPRILEKKVKFKNRKTKNFQNFPIFWVGEMQAKNPQKITDPNLLI
jgi:hypothetical protein